MPINPTQKSMMGESFAGKKTLHIGRPNLGRQRSFIARIKKIWSTRRLSNSGPMVQEFEKRIVEILGVKHAVAMCNATAAIEIACHALGLKGEVIVPSYTFIATAHALQWQGITPVFADMDPATHNLNPEKIEKLITPKTTGIIGVHVWGRGCDTEAIEKVAAKNRLKVMYDASHAFGCSYKGHMIGTFGECEVFSFHATKFINCLEGGVVTTNNDQLAHQMRMMTNFGFTGYDRVEYLGINGKMNEISAAMGLTNLEAMEEIVSTNRKNYEEYLKHLAKIPGLALITYDPSERNNYQYVVVELDARFGEEDRDRMVNGLHAEGVIARKYFWPGCHQMEPYRTLYPHAGLKVPETERVAARIIILPTGQQIARGDIPRICQILRSACGVAEGPQG
jgi:dTDP-4-amino-4,6-dideoxygalactose transaminase